jgi:hypothetical protein
LIAWEVHPGLVVYRTPWSRNWAPLCDVQCLYISHQDTNLQVNMLGATTRRSRIVLKTRAGGAELMFTPAFWEAIQQQCPQAIVGYSEDLERDWSRLSEAEWQSARAAIQKPPDWRD